MSTGLIIPGNAVNTGASGTASGTVSGTNTGDVTISGQNYLSLSGQVLTANAVTLSGSNVTGTLGVGNGGTGATATPTDGQLLIGSSADSKYHAATLTAGSNVTITNSGGGITIAASGGGSSQLYIAKGTNTTASSTGFATILPTTFTSGSRSYTPVAGQTLCIECIFTVATGTSPQMQLQIVKGSTMIAESVAFSVNTGGTVVIVNCSFYFPTTTTCVSNGWGIAQNSAGTPTFAISRAGTLTGMDNTAVTVSSGAENIDVQVKNTNSTPTQTSASFRMWTA